MTNEIEPPATNVIDLSEFRARRDILVFQCKCGSQLFYLRFAEPGLCGGVECRLCGKIDMTKCWGQRDEIG